MDSASVGPSRSDVSEERPVRLKRRLGLWHGITVILGTVIGSSIYIMPSGVIRGTQSGGLALVIWVLCGVISLLGALTFAELGVTFPSSGSAYIYLKKFYGRFIAFMFLWENFFIHRPAANAVKCLTFAYYVVEPFYPDCSPPSTSVKLVAILLAWLVLFINMVNMKIVVRAQTLMVSVATLGLLLIIAVGAYYTATEGTPHMTGLFDNINNNVGDVVIAFFSGIYAYGGWESINYLVEELKNPYRNLPLSLVISMSLVIVLYTLVNLSYQAVIGTAGIIQSPAVAATMFEKVLGRGALVVTAVIAFTTVGSFNAGILSGSRLGLVAAESGHLPKIVSLINIKYLTPVSSLLLQGLVVTVCCIIGDVYTILNNLVFANSFFFALAAAGLIHSRWRHPHLPRPLKLPILVPVIYFIVTVMLLAVPLVTRPISCVMGLLIGCVSGFPFYIFYIMKLWKTPNLDYMSGRLTRLAQIVLVGATSRRIQSPLPVDMQ